MSKITPISSKCISPTVHLSNLLESSEFIEDVVTIVRDEAGDIAVSCSSMSIQDLCFLLKVLEEFVAERVKFIGDEDPIY